MKKIKYNFINPNTDDELADYISKVLTKAIAKNIVYADDTDKLINPKGNQDPIKTRRKTAVNS